MASIISHTAVPISLFLIRGMRAIPWKLLVYGVFLSMLPDIDVLGWGWVPYDSQFGHRGFTHAVFTALIVAFFSARLRFLAKKATVIIFSFLSMASHGIIDAMTNGGLGVALLWPFDQKRYFFGWHEIAVSPIGVKAFFSDRGLIVLRSELVYIWLPCLALALILSRVRKKFS